MKKVDTTPCACAAQAIKQGYMTLDPVCKEKGCKDLLKLKEELRAQS